MVCYGSPDGLRETCSCEHTDRASFGASKESCAVGGGGPESSASFIAFKVNPPLVMSNPWGGALPGTVSVSLSTVSYLGRSLPISGRSRELETSLIGRQGRVRGQIILFKDAAFNFEIPISIFLRSDALMMGLLAAQKDPPQPPPPAKCEVD